MIRFGSHGCDKPFLVQHIVRFPIEPQNRAENFDCSLRPWIPLRILMIWIFQGTSHIHSRAA